MVSSNLEISAVTVPNKGFHLLLRFALKLKLLVRQLKATHRARAHDAMHWRPRFLKALAMSCSFTDALKAAKVCYNTVRAHQRNDPEFAAQLREAEEEGAQLLHDVCFKSALEGNLEPIFCQGKVVGHIQKYDSRMQMEMLRAHMPKTFKTPGSKIAINTGHTQNNTFICDPEEQDALIALRQQAQSNRLPSNGRTRLASNPEKPVTMRSKAVTKIILPVVALQIDRDALDDAAREGRVKLLGSSTRFESPRGGSQMVTGQRQREKF
jgi:hypothetical protein